MDSASQFLMWTFKQKRIELGMQTQHTHTHKKNLSPFPYHLSPSFVCWSHPGIDYFVQLAPLAGWGAASLACDGIQLCNTAQRPSASKREMPQGRKKNNWSHQGVQFDNAEVKFFLVASQGAKEMEGYLRPFLARYHDHGICWAVCDRLGKGCEWREWRLPGNPKAFSPWFRLGIVLMEERAWTSSGEFPTWLAEHRACVLMEVMAGLMKPW